MTNKLTSERSKSVWQWIVQCKEKDGLVYYQKPEGDMKKDFTLNVDIDHTFDIQDASNENM